MSVYNAVGEGPSSPPHEVFVGEAGEHHCASSPPYPSPPLPGEALQEGVWDLRASTSSLGAPTHSGPLSPPVPTAAPRNVAVHGPTATQLDVTWEPPPLESQNGDIQGYKVGVLGREGGPGDPGPGGAWEGPRCGEGERPGSAPAPLAVCIQPTEIHAAGAKRYPSSRHPWGGRHSDARSSGHSPACTIPEASTTPAQPTSSQSQRETP